MHVVQYSVYMYMLQQHHATGYRLHACSKLLYVFWWSCMYPTSTTRRANHGPGRAWMRLKLNLRRKHAGPPTQLHAEATHAVVWELHWGKLKEQLTQCMTEFCCEGELEHTAGPLT